MTRRYLNVLVIILLVPTLVGFRLYNIGIQQGEKYREEAKYIRASRLPASRGNIMSADGVVLAVDRPVWDLYIIIKEYDEDQSVSRSNINVLLNSTHEQRYADDLDGLITSFRQRIEKEKAKELKKSNKKKLSRYLKNLIEKQPRLLYKNVPAEIWTPIMSRPDDFPGFIVKMRSRRVYPEGTLAAHLIGKTGVFSKEDKAKHPYYLDLILKQGESHFHLVTDQEKQKTVFYPYDEIGRTGIEYQYEDLLRGIPGAEVSSSEVVGGKRYKRIIKDLSIKATKGWDFDLTINAKLQRAAESVLAEFSAEKGGGIVIMNARTGAVKAMASYPTFTAGHITQDVLDDKEGAPLLNKCIQGQVPPASIFKIVTSIAALQAGKATPKTTVLCHAGGYRIKGYSKAQRCWITNDHGGAHGLQTVSQALANSCNMWYFVKGSELGMDGLTHWSKILGFGRRTGIDLPSEATGRLPRSGVTNFAIGQGDTLVTIIQVANFMATFANKGQANIPHLVHIADPKAYIGQRIKMNHGTVSAVENGLRMTVSRGTAKGKFIGLEQYDVVGKTGTAQTGKYKKNGEWHKRRAHIWFAGYWKEGDERYAFAICLLNAYKYPRKNGDITNAPEAIATVMRRYYQKEESKKEGDGINENDNSEASPSEEAQEEIR